MGGSLMEVLVALLVASMGLIGIFGLEFKLIRTLQGVMQQPMMDSNPP